MHQVIFSLPPAGSATTTGAKSTPKATGSDFFGALLATRLTSAAPLLAGNPAAVAIPGDGTPETQSKALHALEARIAKMIASGQAQADVIASLAAQLASAVARQLDSPGADTHAQLSKLFTAALAPPGDPSDKTGSVAGRARILAQRFLRLESVAHAIAGRHSGQQNRIAGKLLDAQRAKDIPAPVTTGAAAPAMIGAAAFSGSLDSAALRPALVSRLPRDSASRVESAATPSSSPGDVRANALAHLVPRDASVSGRIEITDRRTVKLGLLAPIASGGDTALGRTLARAAVAADARAALTATVSDTTEASQPAIDAPSQAAVSAFMKSFAATLEASAAAGADPRPAQADTHAASTAEQPVAAAVPAVAPFVIERTGPTTAATPPAPAAVSTPIDHSAIADQVLRGAFLRNVGQSSEMRLSLTPANLGDVNVKLIVNAGTVTAHVVAETSEVRDALVAAQPQLTKSLADAGLKLTAFSVDLSGSGFAGFAQQQNDRSRGQHPNRSPNIDTDATDETLLEAIPSFAPSKSGDASVGDYNYLA